MVVDLIVSPGKYLHNFAQEEVGTYPNGEAWFITEEPDGSWAVFVQAREIASGLKSRSEAKWHALDWGSVHLRRPE